MTRRVLAFSALQLNASTVFPKPSFWMTSRVRTGPVASICFSPWNQVKEAAGLLEGAEHDRLKLDLALTYRGVSVGLMVTPSGPSVEQWDRMCGVRVLWVQCCPLSGHRVCLGAAAKHWTQLG